MAVRHLAQVGEDGFLLLDRLGSPEVSAQLRALLQIDVLRRVWDRHFERRGGPAAGEVQLRPESALPPAAEGIESPYDPEARYRSKSSLYWTGYAAILTETCDADRPNLITHVATTAVVHEVNGTAAIQQALVGLGLPPGEHLSMPGSWLPNSWSAAGRITASAWSVRRAWT